MNAKYRIYIDFDGTIALNDVGDKLFQTFAGEGWEKPIREWAEGHISSKEVFIRECKMMHLTRDTLDAFSNEQRLDPTFKNFIAHCDQNGYPVTILSDGLDLYINKILKNHGFENIPVRSNRLIFENETRVRPEFPYFDKGCTQCGNCKGYHIRKDRIDGETIVYVGDGLSDRCGVAESDIIFAKDDLEKFCIEKTIPYYRFDNFKDVLNKFIDITNGGQ